MAGDDLSRPLGVNRADPSDGPATAVARIVLGALAVASIGAVGWLIVTSDPYGGEPHARVKIERIKDVATGKPPVEAPAQATQAGAAKQRESASEVEAASGVTVRRGQGQGAPDALIIKVPDAAPEAGKPGAVDRRLLERTRHGMLPIASAEAGRPRDVYARPFGAAQAGGKPLVAVMVTGLGIGAGATAEAIAKLPGEVSLAFAPYGNDLEKQAGRARENGHEIFLQLPMEPYDYPDNDPGPQTLLAEAAEAQNLDRLHWLMGRFSGYAGLTNFMGAKFTASRTALKPVFEDAARRGLMFVDDGSSGRSQAGAAAGAANLPLARGDIVLDGLDKAADLEAALVRAETQARASGHVLVVGAALPATVERLTRWVRSLEAKGLVLAPVTAMARMRKG